MQELLPAAEGSFVAEDEGCLFRLSTDLKSDSPHLCEQSRCQLVVTSPVALTNPQLRVGGLSIDEQETSSIDAKQVLGSFKLGYEFGRLEIELLDGNTRKGACFGEVRPRYLDIEEDFALIQNDVQRIGLSIAFAIWKHTSHRMYPSLTVPAGVPEWLALLRALWRRLQRALYEIERDPHKEIVRRREERPAWRAGRVDSHGIRWLARNGKAWEPATNPALFRVNTSHGSFSPTRALLTRNDVTFNTQPNRALKAAVHRLELRLRLVISQLDDVPPQHFASSRRAEYLEELQRISRLLQRFTKSDFLREVPRGESARPADVHVVRADPRYREAFRVMSALRWGLVTNVGGPVVQMALKDTWQLYEYWVYLYLTTLLTDWGWECIDQGVVSPAQGDGQIILDLPRGESSRIRFRKKEPGGGTRIVSFFFHKNFPSRMANRGLGVGALTVTRDVDILVEVQRLGSIRRVVFDPKYRVVFDDPPGCLACPQSAIDDMHVYRDAVGRWEPRPGGGRYFERSLAGAFAIFPSHDEEQWEEHRFADSLEDGVGGVPLLPSGTKPPSRAAALLKVVLGA